MGGELGLGPFATDEIVAKSILRRSEKEKLSNFEQFTSLSKLVFRSTGQVKTRPVLPASEILDKRIRNIGTAIIGDAGRMPFHVLHQAVKIVA